MRSMESWKLRKIRFLPCGALCVARTLSLAICLSHTHADKHLHMSKHMQSYTENNHIRSSQLEAAMFSLRPVGKYVYQKGLLLPLLSFSLASWYALRLIWQQSDQICPIRSHPLHVGPFLTLQFFTQTGKETSTRKDYGLRTLLWPVNMQYAHIFIYICVCLCVLLRWRFGGSGPLIFNLCQFCTAGTVVTHNLFCSHTCTHVRKHLYAHTNRISSAQRCAIWWVVTVCRHRRRPTVSLMFGRHSHWILVQLLLTNCW